jgi:hypothetical protein
MSTADQDPRRTIRKLNLIGLVIVAVLIGGVAAGRRPPNWPAR